MSPHSVTPGDAIVLCSWLAHHTLTKLARVHVRGELSKIAVELAREAEAARRAADRRRDEVVVDVTVRRRRELERADGSSAPRPPSRFRRRCGT